MGSARNRAEGLKMHTTVTDTEATVGQAGKLKKIHTDHSLLTSESYKFNRVYKYRKNDQLTCIKYMCCSVKYIAFDQSPTVQLLFFVTTVPSTA